MARQRDDITKLMRNVRNLGHQKTARTQLGDGIPDNKLGNDGDFRLHMTNFGLKLYAKYNGKWYSFSPDVDAENIVSIDDTNSLQENGSVTLGEGIMIQWGKTDSLGTPVTVTFPTAFPNKCVAVVSNSMVESAVGSTNYNIAVQTYDYTTTNFKARVLGGAGTDYGATNSGFVWIAIGN